LGEHSITRCNSDIGRQKKLMACTLALALDGDDEWLLPAGWYCADWINELGDFRELAGT
jgi:hypothetical protein